MIMVLTPDHLSIELYCRAGASLPVSLSALPMQLSHALHQARTLCQCSPVEGVEAVESSSKPKWPAHFVMFMQIITSLRTVSIPGPMGARKRPVLNADM